MDLPKLEHRLKKMERSLERLHGRVRATERGSLRIDEELRVARDDSTRCEQAFKDDMALAFRNPEKAMGIWKNKEWTARNFVVRRPSEQEVSRKTYAAFSKNLFVERMWLRGVSMFGIEDGTRRVAREALDRLGKRYEAFLDAAARARDMASMQKSLARSLTRLKTQQATLEAEHKALYQNVLTQRRAVLKHERVLTDEHERRRTRSLWREHPEQTQARERQRQARLGLHTLPELPLDRDRSR